MFIVKIFLFVNSIVSQNIVEVGMLCKQKRNALVI